MFRNDHQRLASFCGYLCLLVAVLGTVAIAESPTHPVDWKAVVEMDGQVFPSFIIATANVMPPKEMQEKSLAMGHFGDIKGLIGITIVSPSDNYSLKVEVSGKPIMDDSEIECVLPKAGVKYTVFPKISYHYDDLRKVQQANPIDLTFVVSSDGKRIGKSVETARLRSINDCVMAAPSNCNHDITQTPWMFAAYVNEDHPWIDKLLKEALDTKCVAHFDGYQSNDPAQVYKQVFAIWNVFQRRGIKYSSITDVASVNARVQSQYVRLLDESVEFAQANCVDGSVIFASVLKKIGIDPVLLIVPGHMMVGFYLDKDHKNHVVLETTMLGNTDLKRYPTADALTNLLSMRDKNRASFESFNAAINEGNQHISRIAKENKEKNTHIGIDIDIARFRKLQINPIPYVKP